MSDINAIKNIYVIDIFGEKNIIKYDGKNILVSNISNSDINSLGYEISDYIKHELMYYNEEISKLRPFLSELQKVINSSDKSNVFNNVRDYFFRTTNIFSGTSEKKNENYSIDELKMYKENIMNYKNEKNFGITDEQLNEGIELNGNVIKSGKQKVLSNGKSLLEKDAFVNALVLALIVEISGLVMLTILLFKIM